MICIQKYLIFKSFGLLEDITKLIMDLYIHPRIVKITTRNPELTVWALHIDNYKAPNYVYTDNITYRTDRSFKINCVKEALGIDLYHYWSGGTIKVRFIITGNNIQTILKTINHGLIWTKAKWQYIYLSD